MRPRSSSGLSGPGISRGEVIWLRSVQQILSGPTRCNASGLTEEGWFLMPAKKRKAWVARVFLGRDPDGKQQFHWVGRYSTKRERDDAVARAKAERPWEAPTASIGV